MQMTLIAIAIVVGVAAVGLFYFNNDSTPYWEHPAEFGGFGDEILLIYEDGSEVSVKPKVDSFSIMNPAPLTVKQGGETISQIKYKMWASGVGTVGYDKIYFKTSNNNAYLDSILCTVVIDNENGVPVFYHQYNVHRLTDYIMVNSQYHEIGYFTFDIEEIIEDDPDTFPEGEYTFWLEFSGTLSYHGDSETEWETMSIGAEDLRKKIILQVYRGGGGGDEEPLNEYIGIDWGSTEKYIYT